MNLSPRKQLLLGKKQGLISPHRRAVLGLDNRKPPRVIWDSQMTRLFLQLAIREIETEGRGTTQLSYTSLRNIATEMTRMTQQEINSKQCKNKYQSLRRDWQAWQLLADARRGSTGLGYDPVSGTFTAPPHFWTNIIAVRTPLLNISLTPMQTL